ncbi:hypothetical protein A3J77_01385 [Candidatus Wolfebacteria bacterium RBG_13_41_7]|uniref:Serine protease n=1 Tax=Candidatus Wolfebacteria bacterium RBG_13_41_7 TaxID=1802554 RepID=A0A1F8DMX3_9BACT|nr:MAG: hypothetical protein A3J77_01385 [Candidatus Wolfebacteria bacterium RBG_13_41_7]
MFEKLLVDKIKDVRNSIVAIGFSLDSNQITILGSGFCVSNDGKILTVAHLYNQLNDEQRKNLAAFVMAEERQNDFQRYQWMPIKLVNKIDNNDIALFQIDNYKNTLLKKLELGDSEFVEVGQDAYFIGFPYAAQLMRDGFGVTLITNKAIISNIKRDGVSLGHERNWFILDAISNPGNSGCPLIDIKTNKVIGVMAITFRIGSQIQKELDIKEPMHICGAKPINLAKVLVIN